MSMYILTSEWLLVHLHHPNANLIQQCPADLSAVFNLIILIRFDKIKVILHFGEEIAPASTTAYLHPDHGQ